MNDVHSNIFPTPLQQLQAIYPYKGRFLDVDRAGNGFVLTVRFSLNKKNEVVKDIMLVEHLGYFTFDLHAKFICQSLAIPLWERTVISGDYTQHIQRLEKELRK